MLLALTDHPAVEVEDVDHSDAGSFEVPTGDTINEALRRRELRVRDPHVERHPEAAVDGHHPGGPGRGRGRRRVISGRSPAGAGR